TRRLRVERVTVLVLVLVGGVVLVLRESGERSRAENGEQYCDDVPCVSTVHRDYTFVSLGEVATSLFRFGEYRSPQCDHTVGTDQRGSGSTVAADRVMDDHLAVGVGDARGQSGPQARFLFQQTCHVAGRGDRS